ncbi:hypothetical protein HK097_004519, partial [Rhizophlyctis rosea]
HWLLHLLDDILYDEPDYWSTPLIQNISAFVELKTGMKTIGGFNWSEEYPTLTLFSKSFLYHSTAAYRCFLGNQCKPLSFNFLGPSAAAIERSLPHATYEPGVERQAIQVWLKCHLKMFEDGQSNELIFTRPLGPGSFPASVVIPGTLSFDAITINPSAVLKNGTLYSSIPPLSRELAEELWDSARGMQDALAKLKQIPLAKQAEEFVVCGMRAAFPWPVGIHYSASKKVTDGNAL